MRENLPQSHGSAGVADFGVVATSFGTSGAAELEAFVEDASAALLKSESGENFGFIFSVGGDGVLEAGRFITRFDSSAAAFGSTAGGWRRTLGHRRNKGFFLSLWSSSARS